MKRLAGRIILFLIPLCALLALIDIASLTGKGDALLSRVCMSEGYRHVGSSMISPAIRAVQSESEHTKLILGDSVCTQVFSDYAGENDEYLIQPTNMAVTVDGQYILARLFLESHPQAEDIYLILLPVSFKGRYDSDQSYSYLVEPFGRAETLNYLSDATLTGMKKHYGSLFLNKNVIRIIDGSSINNKICLYYFQKHAKEADNDDIISDEAAYYLNDLHDICREKNVNLHLLAPPVCDSADNADRIERLREAAEGTELSTVFDEYFDSITLYPEDMFMDGHHFKAEYADQVKCSGYIDDMQAKSGELQGLKHMTE